MNRPKLTEQEVKMLILNAPKSIEKSIRALVDKKRISVKEADAYILKAIVAHHDPVRVVGIRGYYKNSMGKPGENDRGIFDDAFAVLGPNYFKTFNGNTDPRRVDHGLALLLPGWHLFAPGPHPRKAPNYPAFRTANAREVTPVIRDGQIGIKEGITINFHSGGNWSTSSAGCQTVYKPQWLEFQKDIYKMLKNEGQRILPYLLLEA
jgi:hypothetical protein